jgi:ribonuclease J
MAHDKKLGKGRRVPVGRVATHAGSELPDEVLRERAMAGRSGVVFVSVVLDRRGSIQSTPRVSQYGVVDHAEGASDVLRAAAIAVSRAITDADPRYRTQDESLTDICRLAARRMIENKTGRRPVVIVSLSRV